MPQFNERVVSYFDRLQTIIDAAKFLQSHPVPEDATTLQLLQMRLGYAEYELQTSIATIAPEVWVGATDDPLRGDRPMALGM